MYKVFKDLKKELIVKKISLFVSIVMVLAMISPSYANEFFNFTKAVKDQVEKSGRPEIIVESGRVIYILFGLKDTMKEFRFDKKSQVYEVREVRKLEDSTRSLWHEKIDKSLKNEDEKT